MSRKSILAGAVVLSLATGALWLRESQTGSRQIARFDAAADPGRGQLVTEVRRTKVPARARAKKVGPVVSGPRRGPAGKVVDMRITLLPPGRDGTRRFRREWLIRPVGSRTPVCVEETCSGDESKPKVEQRAEFSADRMLVTVDGKTDFEAFSREMADRGLTVERPIMTLKSKGNAKLTVVRGSKVALDTVAKIERAVAACDPSATTCRDLIFHAEETPDVFRRPNDLAFSKQWGLERIGAPAAWADRVEATNVVVAVIDTGCNLDHVDLRENLWVNPDEIPRNGVDDDGNGIVDDVHGATFYGDTDYVTKDPKTGRYASLYTYDLGFSTGSPNDGWDAGVVKADFESYRDKSVPDDSPVAGWGHGTHCCGIVAARGDNAVGTAGVAWQARVMPMRFMAPRLVQVADWFGGYSWKWSASGAFNDAIRCMDYAAEHGATVFSCSFGSAPGDVYAAAFDATICDVMEELKSRNVVVACAAGNESTDNDVLPHFPSSCAADNIVAVASSDMTDGFSSFSNWGAAGVDIAAPGSDIYSTYLSAAEGEENRSYASLSGTSMATPMVAGCLALIKAAYPNETYGETIRRLYDAGVPIPAMAGKTATGRRVSLERAILGGDVWTPVAPDVTVSKGTSHDRVAVSWHSTGGLLARIWRASSEDGDLQPLTGWIAATNHEDLTVLPNRTYWYAVQVAKAASDELASALSRRLPGYAKDDDLDDWDNAGDGSPEGATALVPVNVTMGERPRRPLDRHTLSAFDASDWFRVEAEYGASYTFASEGATGVILGDIYRWDGLSALDSPYVKGRTSRGETDLHYREDPQLTIARREDAGTYYVRVRPEKTGTIVEYQGVVCSRTGGYDAWDRNGADDSPEGATDVASPSEIPRVVTGLGLCKYDEADWFRFELKAGATYVFRTTGSANTYGRLFAAGDFERPVAEDEDSGEGGNFFIRYVPETSGFYWLQVSQGYKLIKDRQGNEKVKHFEDTVAYELEYFEEPEKPELNFVFTPDYLWSFLPPEEWLANPFLTTNATEVTPLAAIATDDEGIVRWSFCEDLLEGLEAGRCVTNLVELLSADGVRLMWGHAVCADDLEVAVVDFTTRLPRLPAGMYRVRLSLNRNVSGDVSYLETDLADNVVELPFTVRAAVKAPERLVIDGNAEIVAGARAFYRCVARFADGTSAEVAADWSLDGEAFAAAGELREGRYCIVAGEVEEDEQVVLRAQYGGLSAEKRVTVIAEAGERESKFDPPVYHPDGRMEIAFGLLRIAGAVATEGDEIAAYAVLSDGGSECRSRVRVAGDGTFAMSIPLMREGETIVFKAYDASAGDYGMVFDCLQAVPAVFGAVLGSEGDPLLVDAVRLDPFGTQKLYGHESSDVFAQVTVGGVAAGEGDILAVFDGETLVGKQLVTFQSVGGVGTSSDGTPGAGVSAFSTCALRLYLGPGEHNLVFRIWDASAGRLRDCNETVVLATGESAGSAADPMPITADVPAVETESADPESGGVPEVPDEEPGEPGVTHMVTFDLAGGADRVGGGELVQTVADGASAVAPEIVCRAGHVFGYWNYPTNNVRSDRTITAAYRTSTRTAPARVSYAWLAPRLGAGPHTAAEYEAAALAPTGKTGADGRPTYVWQDYVAGTDPDDPEDLFRADIEIIGGRPRIRWTPDLNTNGVNRLYTVWGKENLTDETWSAPTNAASRFFKVTVDEP